MFALKKYPSILYKTTWFKIQFQYFIQIIMFNWFLWIAPIHFKWQGNLHNLIKLFRFIQTKKVEKPDVVMAIHPRLEGEFWGPTVDMLLDENIKVVFTCFNKDHYEESLERLDYVFVKYLYKGPNTWVSGHTKQSPMDPNMIWASNQYLIVFQVNCSRKST